MNAHPQPGMHPDAEILSAFAEQALGKDEREQLLAHLAVCARCREVVALAQEAAEITAPVQAVRSASQSAWWRTWRLAWAPVAVLACMVTLAIVLHVRRVERETESARKAEALPPHQQALAVTPAKPEAQVSAAPQAGPVAGKHPQVPPAPAASSPQDEAIAAFSSQTEQVAVANDKLTAGSQAPLAVGAPRTPSMSTEAAAWQQQQAPLTAEQKKEIPANERRAWMMAAARPRAEGGPVELAPPAPMPAPNAGGGLFAGARAARLAPLPSGKAAVSTASSGSMTVAVDAAGGVFRSEDRGVHWSPVLQQWSGQAVSVMTKPGAGSTAGASASSEPSEEAPASAVAIAPEVTFEITNEKGQRWTSADGLVWTPE